MERSRPTSGRSATPADINRNGRPTSIGTGGRHQSECPAGIIGIRSLRFDPASATKSYTKTTAYAAPAALITQSGELFGLVHDYTAIKNETVWDVISDDLPRLQAVLAELLKSAPEL
jgi:Protein of unknown function DUF86